MRALLLALLLLTPTRAWSLSQPGSGLTLDLVGDVGFASPPAAPALGGSATVALWRGRYDDSYAVGRFSSVGLRTELHALQHDTGLTFLVEGRRGMDLLIIKPWFTFAVGAEALGDRWNPALRVGGGAKLRLARFVGPVVRLDGGPVFLDGRVGARVNLGLGVDWSHPFTRPKR